MDFGILYQLKIKKYWWIDTILHFVIALLLATFLCFLIFNFKISLESKKLKEFDDKLANVGTAQQREMEKQVFEYQKKIDNFATILNSHKIPTNVLDAFKASTLANVWFTNFSMDAKTSEIRVFGETDDIPSLSRQIEVLENKEFVKNISGLNFDLKEEGRVLFSFDLLLDPKIFFPDLESSLIDIPSGEIIQTTSPSSSLIFNKFIF